MGNYTIFETFENSRGSRQARNFTTDVPKILDLKSSFEQIFSENQRWVPLFHQVHNGSFQGYAIKSSHHANFYLINVCNNRHATSSVFNISFLLTTKSSNTQQSMEWHNNYEQYWIRCTGSSVSSQVIYMKYAILKSSLAHDKKKATLWDCSTMLI